MAPGIEDGEDMFPLPENVRQQFDRRRPPNGEIIHRIEALEVKVDRLLYELGIDDPNNPSQFRQLGREHQFARVGRNFCEQVGYKFLWAVGAVIAMTVAFNSHALLELFKK